MPLSLEEKQYILKAEGYNPDEYDFDDSTGSITPKIQTNPTSQVERPSLNPEITTASLAPSMQQSPLESGLVSAGRNVLPTLSGLGVAAGAQAGLKALGMVPTPLTKLVSFAGPLVAGMAVAAGTASVQEPLLEGGMLSKERGQQALEQNKKSAIVGSVLPNLLAFKPSLGSLSAGGGAGPLSAVRSLAKMSSDKAVKLTDLERANLLNVGLGGALPVATEVATDLYHDQPIDPLSLGINALAGIGISNPHKLGQKVFGFDPIDGPLSRAGREEGQAKGRGYKENVVEEPLTTAQRQSETGVPIDLDVNAYSRSAPSGLKLKQESPEPKPIVEPTLKATPEMLDVLEQKRATELMNKRLEGETYKQQLHEQELKKVEEQNALLRQKTVEVKPIEEPKKIIVEETPEDLQAQAKADMQSKGMNYQVTKPTVTTPEILGQTPEEPVKVETIPAEKKLEMIPEKGRVPLDKVTQVTSGIPDNLVKAMKALGIYRNVQVDVTTKRLYTPDGMEINGKAWKEQNVRKVLASLSDPKNTDTLPHEIFHHFYDDMKASSSPRERAMAAKLEKVVSESNEFRLYNENAVAKGRNKVTAEEYLTQRVGEKSFKLIKEGDKSLFRDVVSNLKVKLLNKPKLGDIDRYFSVKLLEDAPYGETYGRQTDPTSKPIQVSDSDETKKQETDNRPTPQQFLKASDAYDKAVDEGQGRKILEPLKKALDKISDHYSVEERVEIYNSRANKSKYQGKPYERKNKVAIGEYAQEYKLPKDLTYDQIYEYATFADDNNIKSLYRDLVKLNPELASINLKQEGYKTFEGEKKNTIPERDIVAGVGSKFKADNIKYYVEDLKGVSANSKNFDKLLKAPNEAQEEVGVFHSIRNKYQETGNAKVEGNQEKTNGKKEDYELYEEIEAKKKQLMDSNKVFDETTGDFTKEFNELWKESETIKNRNGGHVPVKSKEQHKNQEKTYQEHDYDYYKSRLKDPSLIDKAPLFNSPGSEDKAYAIPALGERKAGLFYIADSKQEANQLVNQLKGKKGFHNIGINHKNIEGRDYYEVHWGEDISHLNHDTDYKEVGSKLGYTDKAIKEHGERLKRLKRLGKLQDAKQEKVFATSLEKSLKEDKPLGVDRARDGYLNLPQMLAKLKQSSPAEYDIFQKAGIEQKFSGRNKVTEAELQSFLDEHAPQAQLVEYGMEGKVSEAKKEYDKMTHEWYETLTATQRRAIDLQAEGRSAASLEAQKMYDNSLTGVDQNKLKAYTYLAKQVKNEPRDTSPRATNYYTTVSALPTNEPMPEWTATKSGKNVQRVDVVIPNTRPLKDNFHPENWKAALKAGTVKEGETTTNELWRQDNLHENLPNTLGWAMIQYKTGPKGEKIAVVAEAQSRWGQEVREGKKAGEENRKQDPYYKNYVEDKDHPLLKDYNRLILKAAIEQARKEGATHIMVSDSETAMMTEGHDAQVIPAGDLSNRWASKEVAEKKAKETGDSRNTQMTVRQHEDGLWRSVSLGLPLQEKGMRLNYDTILPKIAEELTGNKGDRVSLGEHKNAYDTIRTRGEGAKVEQRLRDNLIFKNADGSAKTDISGMMYPIEGTSIKQRRDAGEPYSLFGKKYQQKNQEKVLANEEMEANPTGEKYGFFKFLESSNDKVKSQHDEELGSALNRVANEKDLLLKYRNLAQEAISHYTQEELSNVAAWRRAMMRKEGNKPDLTEREVSLNEELSPLFSGIRDEQIEADMKIDGREAGRNEYYISDMPSEKALRIFTKAPKSSESYALQEDWVKYMMDRGIGEVAARQEVKDYLRALATDHKTTTEFNALRKPMGFGLPESMREMNGAKLISKYFSRAAGDLAFFKHIESQPGIAKKLEEFGGTPEVKASMRWLLGDFTNQNKATEYLNAASRVVNNSIMGIATGVRDVANIVALTTPYIHGIKELSAYGKAFSNWSKSKREALKTNAIRHNLDLMQWNNVESNSTEALDRVHQLADLMRKYQGRELIEQSGRIYTFGLGEEFTKLNLDRHFSGDSKGTDFLEKFSGDGLIDIKKLNNPEDVTPEMISQFAKHFVDRVQGSYDGRGLPAEINEGPLAPFFALSKWSVEKSNVIYKDVVKPMQKGDYKPFLMYTLGTVLTGAGIRELNELMSNKKDQNASIKESNRAGDSLDQAAAVINLMQQGSYAGIVGDSIKATSDILIKKQLPRGLSFPLMDFAAETMSKNIADYLQARHEGGDEVELATMFVQKILSDTVQNWRLVSNQLQTDEMDRKDKYRDLRVYNQLKEGRNNSTYASPNPFVNAKEKAFKREDDLKKSVEQLSSILKDYTSKYKNDPIKLKKKLDSLKQNSYQIMPSMKADLPKFVEYYQYIKQTQGQEKADKLVEQFLTQNKKNQIKSSLVPSL